MLLPVCWICFDIEHFRRRVYIQQVNVSVHIGWVAIFINLTKVSSIDRTFSDRQYGSASPWNALKSHDRKVTSNYDANPWWINGKKWTNSIRRQYGTIFDWMVFNTVRNFNELFHSNEQLQSNSNVCLFLCSLLSIAMHRFAEAYDIFINNNSDSSLTSQDSGFSRRSDSEAIESPSEPSISIDSAIVTTSHNNAESPAQHSNQLNLVPVSTANGVSSGVIVNEGN